MSKIWKWILGILLVLVIIGAFVTIGFAWRTHAIGMASYRSAPFDQNWNGPMMGRDNDNRGQPQMWQGDGGWQHPMTYAPGACAGAYDRAFRPMGGGFFLLGGLVKLALFFGLLYGAYWLGRRNARIALDPVPAAPVAEVPAPEAETPLTTSKRAKKTE